MLNRIFNYESKSEPVTDCYQCRMIGGGGLLGIGGYIIYYSFTKRNSNSINKLAIFASSFVGSVVMTLGLFRLTGINDLYRQVPSSHESAPIANDPELLQD